jgi:hypothetical protein
LHTRVGCVLERPPSLAVLPGSDDKVATSQA